MKIFLSWSGERSKAVASALRDWLHLVLHYVEPWMSQHDIAAGERWSNEVGNELEACNFGIVCLTKDNLRAPWLLFEAGALSKQISQAAVVPYLLDVDFADIIQSPLGLFQGKKAEKSQTYDLITAINGRAEKPGDAQRLRRLFEATWPELDGKLCAIPKAIGSTATPRRQEEILEELIWLFKGLDQRICRVEVALRHLEDYRPSLGRDGQPGQRLVIPVRLRTVRKIREMSHAQLSEAATVHPVDLQIIEEGNTIPLRVEAISRLASVLGVPPGVLTGDEPMPEGISIKAPSRET